MKPELLFNKKNIEIFKGDNLDVLRSLKNESIDLIYSDILYNSGKKFDNYEDNLGSPKEAMEWYRPRIEEMYRVLSKTGSIYLHCNWRLDSYIRMLLDEIFGFYNFKNRIYRKHSKSRGFIENYDSEVDIILYYTKDRNNYTFNEIIGEKLNIIPVYENGYVKEKSFNFEYKDFKFNPIEKNKHFLVPEYKLKELYDKGELILIDGFPYRKTYAIPIGNLWDSEDMLDPYSRFETAEAYDTPKPPKLLNRIIEISSNKCDTIADFFMGGGKIVEETLNLERKGIFCDISQKACNITINNLNKKIEEMKK